MAEELKDMDKQYELQVLGKMLFASTPADKKRLSVICKRVNQIKRSKN